MSSIPDSFIDELRMKVDLADLIGRYVTLKRAGGRYMAVCPFHGDTNPSMSVNPDRGFWYCFGCQAGGDAISFIRQKEGLEFVEAVQFLAKMYGLIVPMETGQFAGTKSKDLYEINEIAATLFQKYFKSKHGRNFREYIARRGFKRETVETYRIGGSPDAWTFLTDQLKKRNVDEKDALETGLLMKSENGRVYDRFRGRLMIPIIDNLGRVVGFGGRAMGEDGPKYMNSPESRIFHKSQILFGLNQARESARDSKQLLIMEGYTDVMLCSQYGIKNCCAVMGTALTEEHIPILQRFADEVVLIFDGDEAGIRATVRSLQALAGAEFNVRVLTIKKGQDPAEIVAKVGGEKFRAAVAKARKSSDWMFNHFAEPVRESDIRTKLKAFREIAPYIIAHRSDYIRGELIERAGIAFSLPASALKEELRRSREKTPTQTLVSQSTLEATMKGIESVERGFFLALISNPDCLTEIKRLVGHDDFEYGIHRRFARVLFQDGFSFVSGDSITRQREVYEDPDLFKFAVGLISELDKSLEDNPNQPPYSEKELKSCLLVFLKRQYDSRTRDIREKLTALQENSASGSEETKTKILELMRERQELDVDFKDIMCSLEGNPE